MFGGRKRREEKQPDTEALARVEVGKVVVEVRRPKPGGTTGFLRVVDGGKVVEVALNLDDVSKIRAGLAILRDELRILVTHNALPGRHDTKT